MNETLEKINDIQYEIVSIPFHGTPVFVKLKTLTSLQIRSCGDFSLIETMDDKIRMKEKPKLSEIIAYAEKQYKLCKEALVSPTYDEIFEIAGADPKIKEKLELIEELKKELQKTKAGPERTELENRLNNLKIWCYYILPEDFVAYITSWVLQIDKTDIKKVTDKILLDAAILAINGHDNPADHVDGNLTEYNYDDINRRAWTIYGEWKKNNSKSRR
jgi:hypothetical protein